MKKRTVSQEKMIISSMQMQRKHVDTDERDKMFQYWGMHFACKSRWKKGSANFTDQKDLRSNGSPN